MLFVIHFRSKAKSFDKDPLLLSLNFPTFFFQDLFFCAFFINLVLIKKKKKEVFYTWHNSTSRLRESKEKALLEQQQFELEREKGQEESPVGFTRKLPDFNS